MAQGEVNIPLDVEKLNSVTGGKLNFQEELLEIFFFNVAECIAAMERHCKEGRSEKWQAASKELRDISSSLGANELALLCDVVHKNPLDSSAEKKEALNNIRANVQRLRAFIRNTRY